MITSVSFGRRFMLAAGVVVWSGYASYGYACPSNCQDTEACASAPGPTCTTETICTIVGGKEVCETIYSYYAV